MKNMKKKLFLILCPLFIIVIMFLIAPFLTVFEGSFRKDGESTYSLYNYMYVFKSKLYLKSILNSFRISIYSSVLGIIIATQGAYSLTKLNDRIKQKFTLLSNMLSNFSGLPLAFAFILILGNSGFITLILKQLNLIEGFDIYTEKGVVLAYTYFQIPLGILLLYPGFEALKDDWHEVANILGASKFYYWRKIVIPNILPSFIGTWIILFANGMGAYATAYGLTGSNFNILPIRIAGLVAGDIILKPNLAAALAIILTSILMITITLKEFFLKKSRR